MTDFIQDGTGTGYRAQVDTKNRLKTISTIETGGTDAALEGNLYNVNSGTITLTSANLSSLLYIKNTDSVSWILNRVFYNAGVSTGGTGEFLAEVIANPTTGTLISSGTDSQAHNLNFGSSKQLTADLKIGIEGSTITDGQVRVGTIIPTSGTRVLIAFDSIVLEPGSSLSVDITPQTGNTSMNIQVGLNLYRLEI